MNKDAHDLIWPTLKSLLGKATAMEFALQALTASHPSLDAMRFVWQSNKPELIDQLSTNVLYVESSEFRNGVNHVLALLEQAQTAAP